jgi:phosphohistidine phosphatase
MKILIFRHGIAEPGKPELPDPDRQLTRQGYNRTRLAAIGLTRLMRPVDAILTSPYARAEQTAIILGQAMRRTPETLPQLAADQPPQSVIDAVLAREDTSVALVGHNPQLEEIVALLCRGNAAVVPTDPKPPAAPSTPANSPLADPGSGDPADPPVKIRRLTPISKAGAVLLRAKSYPEKPATLRWAVTPRTLRMLARRLPRQRPPFPACDTGIRVEEPPPSTDSV